MGLVKYDKMGNNGKNDIIGSK